MPQTIERKLSGDPEYIIALMDYKNSEHIIYIASTFDPEYMITRVLQNFHSNKALLKWANAFKAKYTKIHPMPLSIALDRYTNGIQQPLPTLPKSEVWLVWNILGYADHPSEYMDNEGRIHRIKADNQQAKFIKQAIENDHPVFNAKAFGRPKGVENKPLDLDGLRRDYTRCMTKLTANRGILERLNTQIESCYNELTLPKLTGKRTQLQGVLEKLETKLDKLTYKLLAAGADPKSF